MSLERITCTSCSASRFDHDSQGNLICAHCGTNFGAPQDHIDCPSCGVQNPAQARKCMNCGLSLGKTCAICNTSNPPGADHCLKCATPLDTLSSVLMRGKQGNRRASRTMHQELVRTKSEDQVFMETERSKLDEEEAERLRRLRDRQTEAQRQQRMIMAFTIFGGLVLLAFLLIFLTYAQ
jgi:ribosomal protein L40E